MTHTATANNGASRLSRIAPGLASLLHYRFGEDRQRIGPGSARDVALARANLGTFRVGRQDLRAVQQQQVQGPCVGRSLDAGSDRPFFL
jgi:hypothetical protein